MEADDFVLPALPVLEHTVDHPGLEHLAVHRLEVLLRCEVDDHRGGVGLQALVQVVGNLGAPELVQRLAFVGGQPGAHLQPVGLQQIQRAQHAIQPAEDGQVVLRPGQVGLGQAAGGQAVVHITVKRQHGLPRILRG